MIVSYLSCLVCLYIHFILIITLHFQFSIDATNLVRRLPLSDLSTTEARNFIKLNLHLSDLVSYLQPHGGVTRINDRESICLCPFHQDTNPSLRLRDEKQYYHCFSCGAHGDVVTFVMKSQDLSYSAAVRHLIILLESGVLLTKPLPSPSPSLPITSYPINQLHRVTKPTPFKQAIPVVLSKPPVEAAPKPLSVYFDLLRNASNYFSAHLLEVSADS